MPALEGLEGFVGLSLLVDHESGRCIATSAWQSEDAMHASAPQIRQMRDRAADSFGGTPDVEEWEFAVMHRDHSAGEGACVHVAWANVDRDRIDAGIEMVKTSVIPALDELGGLCGFSLLVDRARGRAVTSAAYDSKEAMDRARAQTEDLTSTTVEQSGAEILEEGDFELAIAHLRVPELV
jgi:quinol monooxygenase YgiN